MKFHLYKIRVNQSGYDASGRYWGVNYGSGDVYEYATADQPHIVRNMRARDRSQVKAWIRSCYPNATFYR